MAVPSLSDWQEERQLDLAAEELASAIREAETEARSETSRYGNVVARTYFFCAQDGDHVSYFTRKGTTTIRPKGSFPENIRGTGNLNLTLRKDGYADKNRLQFVLTRKNQEYASAMFGAQAGYAQPLAQSPQQMPAQSQPQQQPPQQQGTPNSNVPTWAR